MLKVSKNCNKKHPQVHISGLLYSLYQKKNVPIVMFESLELILMTFYIAYKILATDFTLEV